MTQPQRINAEQQSKCMFMIGIVFGWMAAAEIFFPGARNRLASFKQCVQLATFPIWLSLVIPSVSSANKIDDSELYSAACFGLAGGFFMILPFFQLLRRPSLEKFFLCLFVSPIAASVSYHLWHKPLLQNQESIITENSAAFLRND